MFIKVDDMYFESFEEICKYYDKTALDFDDFQEQLEEEYGGVGVPEIKTIDKYEVEVVFGNSVNNEYLNDYDSSSNYFNTHDEARRFFNQCVMEIEYELKFDSNSEELPIGIYLREYDYNNCGEFEESEVKLFSLKQDNFKVKVEN